MSIEYTLDIQLTELGFPNILEEQDASTPLSIPHKQVPQTVTKEKESIVLTQNSKPPDASIPSQLQSKESTCPLLTPTPSLQGGQDEKGPPVNDHTAGSESPIQVQQNADKNVNEEAAAAHGNSTEDSEDSDVSDDYDDELMEEELDDDENEEELSSESSSSGSYICSICQLQLPSKFKLDDHMNMHTGARPYCCAECGKRFCQIHSYRVHLRVHAKAKAERHKCRICLIDFPSVEGLRGHFSKTHFEKKFFECDLCKRVFTNLTECQRHVELHKQGFGLNFTCEVCHRNFTSQKLLSRHQRKICHRTFRCTDCSETFAKKNTLLKHSFSHLGLLPYTCIRCRCHFRLAKLYRQHKCEPELIHCVACLRKFNSEKDFKQHKVDTGCWGNQETKDKSDELRCLECGEKFNTTDELKKHAGAHQRVLKCAECGKGFRSALLLMSHMGGHAGQSPCLCQICGLGFPHQQNYDSHLKTCGQTPLPVSIFEKRQTLKNPIKENRKVYAKLHPANTKPTASLLISTTTAPVADIPVGFLKDPARPSKPTATVDKNCFVQETMTKAPSPVTGNIAVGNKVGGSKAPKRIASRSSSSDTMWKLSLDTPPPAGVEVVMFVPVCPTQPSELSLSPLIPQTLALPPMQALTQVTVPSTPTTIQFGANATFGLPLNTPLDIPTLNNESLDAPLDLSTKSKPPESGTVKDIPLSPLDIQVRDVRSLKKD